jgi:peptidylprolyl isomerase
VLFCGTGSKLRPTTNETGEENLMSQAQNGNTVKVHYTGRLDDGSIFDTSDGRDPLEFTIGEGQILRGFEQAVIGMTPGDSKSTMIPSENAYGPRHEDMVILVDRENVPQAVKPQVGQQLQIRDQQGQTFYVLVTEVTEANVTLDANHPLAGQNLSFEIKLMEIV